MLTEYLDGALARRFGWQSALGQILDPLADKILFASVAGTFLLEDRIGWGEVLALGIRDLAVALGALWVAAHRHWRGFTRMEPRLAGKATTALQYLAFFIVLLGRRMPFWLSVLIFALGSVAAIQYVARFRRQELQTHRQPARRRMAA
jgi:cardiolipin synthase